MFKLLKFLIVTLTLFQLGNNSNAQTVGDVMPYYDVSTSKFYVYYLRDIWNDGTGQRHPWNALTTTDCVSYTEMGEKLSCSTDVCKQDFAIGTGSVFKEGSTYYAFYTGHNPNPAPESCVTTKEGVMLATSTGANTAFTKMTSFNTIYAPVGYDLLDNFRDPYVFQDGSTYYMLVAARTSVNGTWKGVVAKYTSTNLTSWSYAGVLYDGGSFNYFMMECPQIFKMGSTYYLTFSFTDTKNVYYCKSSSVNGPWSNPVGTNILSGVGYSARTASNGTATYIWGWQVNGTTWAGQLICNQLLQDSNGDLVVTSITSVNIPVTGVSVSPTATTINLGATQQLIATVAPANASNKTVTWSSSDSSIASVNSSGHVTGVATGTATITVTTQDGSKTATCAVTVSTSTGLVSGIYEIIARHSGKAMDVDQGASLVQQWDYLGGENQKWEVVPTTPNGYYTISSVNGGKVIDSDGSANGAKIQIWSDLGGDNQKWQIVDLGNGYFKILSKIVSDRAIEVTGSSLNNGALLKLVDYTGGTQQQWNFVLLEATSLESTAEEKSKVVVFPIPAKDIFTIDLSPFNQEKDVNIVITDVFGKMITTVKASDIKYSISSKNLGMNSGIYFIKVKSENRTSVAKMVIE